jgi:selenide,water dikinase
MGGRPIMALAIVGMPIDKMSPDTIGAILAGGAAVCAAAGVPVAGGHSIDSAEPIYGLVALGLVHPDQVLKNAAAKAGDVLILTKAIGVGVYSAALKQERLSDAHYASLIDTTTRLNTVGAALAGRAGVHAVTDVTGFGLAGHALEVARGSGLTVRIEAGAVPLLPGVEELVRAGVRTGASTRNWASYGADVRLPAGFEDWRRDLMTDPQTSGGLLIAVAPGEAEDVLSLCRAEGFARAAIVGRLAEGAPGLEVAA